jgi:hypothetical protein
LKCGNFQNDAPTAITRLYRLIDMPNFRTSRFDEGVGRFILARGRFHTESEQNISAGLFVGLKQPGVAHQPHIAQAAGARAVAIAVMVEHGGAFRMKKWYRQRKTVAGCEGIGRLQIDRVDPIARDDFLAGFPNLITDVPILRLQESIMNRCFPFSSLKNPQSLRRQIRRHEASRHASLCKHFLFGCKQSAKHCENEAADSGTITQVVLHLAVFLEALNGGFSCGIE